ncbi:hypothetical protein Rhopal_001272-T1 [Rhodotorula paludigena]|uniref:Cation/H+ exchanger transmembrane domain-containing protein n=1 Tax=Rhodotorula paludigena TaxID=86838 RepID=A0AAV5GG26_9BASI|nr:hypothetical protein Rhopal_001272-T1 [Rhodotorula paludigena]
MSSSSVPHVTATLVGSPLATVTATLGPVPTPTAHPATIFDPEFGSPVRFDSSNPLVLFIVQAFIIVALSRILHFGLRYLKQPRVIAEVIAGILIGPSVLGRVPGFTDAIFPAPSVPYINLVANIGLCLFLFLVGVEVDFSLFRRNALVSSSISILGLVIPFGLGAAVSKAIYDNFVNASEVDYGTFLLFIGTANAITAFPVLARILTDENLLRDHVGVIVLSAGVGNDVIGWILLALAIALVNSASGLIVLYVILTSVAWTLVLWFVGRPLLKFVGRKTRSFGEHGPSQSMTAFTLFLVLTSAWITDRIGVHAIFGAFLVGLIVPKEIRGPLTEKIEDLVTVLFLPLYFALSGLKTDLGLLRDGSIWGYTVLVIVVAFFSKFFACGGVAKAFGMDWRESGAVGSLMACKGLVELIVLNIGLNAGILNPPVFAIFVVMALVTTFITTPLTIAFYPAWYRIKADRLRRGLSASPSTDDKSASAGFGEEKVRTRFALVVEQFEHLPAVMAFLRLVQPVAALDDVKALEVPTTTSAGAARSSIADEKRELAAAVDADEAPSAAADRAINADADSPSSTPARATLRRPGALQLAILRLVELTDRTSALLRAAEHESALIRSDALSTVVRAFASGLGAGVRRFALAIVAQEGYARHVADFAEEDETEVVLVPWALPEAPSSSAPSAASGNASTSGGANASSSTAGGGGEAGVAESWIPNPLEGLFFPASEGGGSSLAQRASLSVQSAVGYATYVREVFSAAPCDVALLVDRSNSATTGPVPVAGRAHLFLAFHGGSDDRLALALVAQLVCAHSGLTATVVRLERAPEPTEQDRDVLGLSSSAAGDGAPTTPFSTRDDEPLFTIHGGGAGDTLYPTTVAGRSGRGSGGAAGTQSETEDDVLFARYFPTTTTPESGRDDDGADEHAIPPAARARIALEHVSSSAPLAYGLARLGAVRRALAGEDSSAAQAQKRVPLVVVAGRGRRDAPSQAAELAALLQRPAAREAISRSVVASSEVRRALGDAGSAAVLAGEMERAGTRDADERVLVVQRGGKRGRVPGRASAAVAAAKAAEGTEGEQVKSA